MSRDTVTNLSRVDSSERAPSPQPRGPKQLTDRQRSRLFACLCVARYIHNAKDNDDACSMDIYEETLALMEPHWQPLEFDHEPSYASVCKIWKDFLRTGLVAPVRLKTKHGSKSTRLALSDDDTNAKKDSKSSLTRYSVWGLIMLCLMISFILNFISAHKPHDDLAARNSKQQYELKVRNQIDDIRSKYPGSLMPKQLKTIQARLGMMKKEVSVLLLLGRSRDVQCRVDKTFCIGRAIANVTQYSQFGYIDACDVRLDSNSMITELSEALDERNDVMMIDSLDRLPGSEVMNLFQFIDRDETNKRRRGLLLLIMYADKNLDDASIGSMRDAEIVERLLVPRWSKYVKSDTLTSVISRISGTIVRVQ